MKQTLLVLAILVFTPGVGFSQSPSPRTHKRISGCLTSRPFGYRLTNKKGTTNITYSTTLHLDSYIGQFVTLVGNESVTPSTDTGTGRPTVDFKVVKVQPASGNCKPGQ